MHSGTDVGQPLAEKCGRSLRPLRAETAMPCRRELEKSRGG
jgi:hypothetical protein